MWGLCATRTDARGIQLRNEKGRAGVERVSEGIYRCSDFLGRALCALTCLPATVNSVDLGSLSVCAVNHTACEGEQRLRYARADSVRLSKNALHQVIALPAILETTSDMNSGFVTSVTER